MFAVCLFHVSVTCSAIQRVCSFVVIIPGAKDWPVLSKQVVIVCRNRPSTPTITSVIRSSVSKSSLMLNEYSHFKTYSFFPIGAFHVHLTNRSLIFSQTRCVSIWFGECELFSGLYLVDQSWPVSSGPANARAASHVHATSSLTRSISGIFAIILLVLGLGLNRTTMEVGYYNYYSYHSYYLVYFL